MKRTLLKKHTYMNLHFIFFNLLIATTLNQKIMVKLLEMIRKLIFYERNVKNWFFSNQRVNFDSENGKNCLILPVFRNHPSILIFRDFPGNGHNFPGKAYWQFPGNFPVGKKPGKITKPVHRFSDLTAVRFKTLNLFPYCKIKGL